nr:VOC family protein [Actinopolymorpha cephalotaxi]
MWHGRGHTGAGLWGDPGAVTWNELATPDGAVADAFYRAIFDYDAQAPADPGVTVWKAGGHDVCSRRETTEVEPQWITYFAVADTDQAVGKVRRQGGRVEREPWDSPHGRLACVADPAGISFRLAGPLSAA